MDTTYTLLFYLKKEKDYTSGSIFVYGRITINGLRKEFSTGLRCNPEKWNSDACQQKGTHPDVKSFNAYLETISRNIFNAHKSLLDDGKLITAEVLRNKFLGKDQKPLSLVEIFKDHNKQMFDLIDKKYAQGTHQRYVTTLKHLQDFMQSKYRVSDRDIRTIDLEFITGFEFYLRTVRNCQNNASVKYVKNLHKIVLICLKNRWLKEDPFIRYDGKMLETDPVFLTQRELQDIIKKTFTVKRLEQVRDIFIFSCLTGLAYIDVKKLDKSHFSKGIDGGLWLFKNRQKTDTKSSIPMLPMANEILIKYESDPECRYKNKVLPILSNQKMNSYLKEIADLCGINKELTYHVARHTFATTVTLSNGVPIESVSKMLGHRDLKTTQHYARVLDEKLSNDMAALTEKMKVSQLAVQNHVG